MQAGQGLLLAALEHIRAAPAADTVASRIGVLYNPTDPEKEPSLLAKLLLVVLDLPSRRPKIPGKCSLGDRTSDLCLWNGCPLDEARWQSKVLVMSSCGILIRLQLGLIIVLQ